ncbi:MAG: hypothetical protein HOP07_16645 [Bacteriovoracaceae bacterium]|nr:hypothetical protein [Bacteriovoracaceae bacterium]
MIKQTGGFTFLEAIITMAVLAGSVLVLVGGVADLNKSVSKIKVSRQSKDIVSELINTFSASAPLMQVDYSPSAVFPNTLPIAWDTNGKKMLLSDCTLPCELRGRMGVLIIPTQNKRLFLMKVRISHPNWSLSKESSHLLGAE